MLKAQQRNSMALIFLMSMGAFAQAQETVCGAPIEVTVSPVGAGNASLTGNAENCVAQLTATPLGAYVFAYWEIEEDRGFGLQSYSLYLDRSRVR